jgi:hypothetical protein
LVFGRDAIWQIGGYFVVAIVALGYAIYYRVRLRRASAASARKPAERETLT